MPNIAANSVVVRRADAETRSETDCVASMTTSVLLIQSLEHLSVRSHGRSPGSWRFSSAIAFPDVSSGAPVFGSYGAAPFYSRGVGCGLDARSGSTRHIPFSSRFALGIAGTV